MGRLLPAVLGRDLAIDLGTANTVVHVRGRGIVLDEPSVVALNARTGAVLAIGTEAKAMFGRTPAHISAIRPLRRGVIDDVDVTEQMLRGFLRRVAGRRPAVVSRPRAVVCVPSGVSGLEQRAVQQACVHAGARAAYVIEEPMAAAIGAGLAVHEPTATMIVDIGGGTTEVAVIALGGIVASASTRVGGDQLDEAIVEHVRTQHSLMLGERTAEEIKLAIGSAHPQDEERHAEIRGRDLHSGLPRTIVVSAGEIRDALAEPLRAIVGSVTATLDRTPPELAADVMTEGIVLAGGGALLPGLVDRCGAATGLPFRLAPNPLHAVVIGSGRCVEQFEALRRVLVPTSRH